MYRLAATVLSASTRRRYVLLLAAIALFALLIARWPAPPLDLLPAERQVVETQKPQVCLHTLLENEVEEAKILRSLELVRELGATTIVQFFPWAYFEPQKDFFNWTQADLIIRHAERQGLQIIARLGLAPAWARPSSAAHITTLTYLPAESFTQFAEYAAAFAQRYADTVEHIIIWNEPNLSLEWGYRPVDPAAYTQLLQATYPLVKRANPAAVLLAGALAPTLEPPGSSAGLNELDFLQAMYAAGAAEYFDALAIHSYGFRAPPEFEPGPARLNFRRAELLRTLMLDKGDGAKPVYITESGWNDHPRWTLAVRPAQRSAYTIRAFQYAEENWHWLERLCLWALRYPADLHSYPDNFTLVSADFGRKPIYFALQEYARGWARSETLWLPPPRES